MSEKTKGEQLREELLMNPKNLTETMSEEELKAAYDFCEGYKTFLDAAKTEREAVTTAVAMLEKAGYVPFDHAKQYKAGDKVYLNNRGKALIAATLGRPQRRRRRPHRCGSYRQPPSGPQAPAPV